MQTKETGKRKVVTYNLRISKAGGLADSEKDLEMLQQIDKNRFTFRNVFKRAHTRDKNCKTVKKRKHIVDINRNRRTEHLINSYKSTSDNVENTIPCVCGWVGG